MDTASADYEDMAAFTAAVNNLGSGWVAHFNSFPNHPNVTVNTPDGRSITVDNWVNGPDWEFGVLTDGEQTGYILDFPRKGGVTAAAAYMARAYGENKIEAMG